MALSEKERLALLWQVMLAGKRRGETVAPSRAVMARLLGEAFGGIVDESWYLQRYPDVAQAISQGAIGSAREHFLLIGLYEGRVPYAIEIDDATYLRKHRDVADSVRSGVYADGREHFFASGFAEGRSFQLRSGH